MQIAAAASQVAFSPDRLASAIGIRVARKALDAQQQQGDAAVELIKAAAAVAKSPAAAPTAAGRLDRYA